MQTGTETRRLGLMSADGELCDNYYYDTRLFHLVPVMLTILMTTVIMIMRCNYLLI